MSNGFHALSFLGLLSGILHKMYIRQTDFMSSQNIKYEYDMNQDNHVNIAMRHWTPPLYPEIWCKIIKHCGLVCDSVMFSLRFRLYFIIDIAFRLVR